MTVRPEGGRDLLPLVVFLLPVVVGVVFWSDSSGNGDAFGHRRYVVALCENGILPLAKMEWFHPAHNVSLGLIGFSGVLDDRGRATAYAPTSLVSRGVGLAAVVIILERAGDLPSARTASDPIRLAR